MLSGGLMVNSELQQTDMHTQGTMWVAQLHENLSVRFS